MSAGSVELSIESLQAIIKGKVIFRQCPDCDGTGAWHYIEGFDEPVSRKEYEDAGGANNLDNDTGRCDTCKGLAYVTNDIQFG